MQIMMVQMMMMMMMTMMMVMMMVMVMINLMLLIMSPGEERECWSQVGISVTVQQIWWEWFLNQFLANQCGENDLTNYYWPINIVRIIFKPMFGENDFFIGQSFLLVKHYGESVFNFFIG